MQVAVHLVGDAGASLEDRASDRGQRPVAGAVAPPRRRQAEPVRGRVAAGQRQRQHAADHDRRPLRPPVAEDERPTDERRIGDDDPSRFNGVRRHDGVMLQTCRLHEHVLDVEGQGLRAAEAGPIREPDVEVLAVVEVGIGGQREVAGPGARHCGGEAGAGDEAHPVAASDEVAGDFQQGADVAVDRNAGDEDRGHDRAAPGASDIDCYDDSIHHYVITVNRGVGSERLTLHAGVPVGVAPAASDGDPAASARHRSGPVRRARLRPDHAGEDRHRRRRVDRDRPGPGVQSGADDRIGRVRGVRCRRRSQHPRPRHRPTLRRHHRARRSRRLHRRRADDDPRALGGRDAGAVRRGRQRPRARQLPRRAHRRRWPTDPPHPRDLRRTKLAPR